MATINDFINKLTQTKKPNLGTGFLGTSKPATNNFGGLVTPKPASPVVNQSMSPNGATAPKPTVITPPKTPSITSNPKETFINNLTNTGAPKIDTPTTPTTPTTPVSNPQNDYLEYLRKQFNPEKGATLSTAKESALTRVNEIQARNRKAELDAIAEQEKTRVAPGGLKSGTDQAIGEIGRKANLEGAYGALEENAAVASANLAKDTYNDYINAGKSVYEAEQAALKVKNEQNKPFELSEGQARYEFDSASGQYKKVASVGKTYAPSSGGGTAGSPGGITQAVIANPALYSTLTPTVKGQVIREMQAQGLDTNALTIPSLNNTQREQIDSFDTLKREAQLAKTYLESGLNTGPVASRLSKGSAMLGGAKDFTQYRSSIDNLGSILIKARSGAAVTPQEFERIKGFIPGVNDDEKTAITKIDRFFSELEAAQNNYIKRATQTSQQIASTQNTSTKSGGGDPLGIR